MTPEPRAARILELWSVQLLCCSGVPPAPFHSMLCGGASLAAGLAGTGLEDLFQGFHGARTARGTQQGTTPGLGPSGVL
eukprot:2767618-Rhodomonas_salina.1